MRWNSPSNARKSAIVMTAKMAGGSIMTFYANIVSTGKPSRKEVDSEIRYSHDVPSGKKLKSFTAEVNRLATQMDSYTSYHNVYADHYDVYAVYE